MEEQLNKLVDHLISSTISQITEKLPEIVKQTVYKQLEQVYKIQTDIQSDLGDIRGDLNGFDKRISDLTILVNTIEGRTAQIKVTQDEQPLKTKKSMEKHITNAINDAVESAVPEAMMSVVEPRKDTLQAISKKSLFSKIKGVNKIWQGQSYNHQ